MSTSPPLREGSVREAMKVLHLVSELDVVENVERMFI